MVGAVRAAAVVILAVMIGFAAGCTNVTADQHGSSSPVGSVSAPITTGPATPTSAASSTVAPAFDCGDYIGTAAPASLAPLQVVLGVVALPTSPQNPALGTSLTGQTGPQRLFAKTGLLIKPGATFDIVVPTQYADHVRIGWGNGPIAPTTRFAVADCANPGGTEWLAYPGGYWIDHPACVPLIVMADGKQQQVHVGLGTNCAGQQPPAAPNQR